MKIRISKKIIGEDSPVFIIAEAGLNHNGNVNIAKKLINSAQKCGANAIKFQTFKANKLSSDELILLLNEILETFLAFKDEIIKEFFHSGNASPV